MGADLLLSLSLDLHHIITGSYIMIQFFWNGLQPDNGSFQVYFGVTVEEMWKEKDERVFFGVHFLRIHLFA